MPILSKETVKLLNESGRLSGKLVDAVHADVENIGPLVVGFGVASRNSDDHSRCIDVKERLTGATVAKFQIQGDISNCGYCNLHNLQANYHGLRDVIKHGVPLTADGNIMLNQLIIGNCKIGDKLVERVHEGIFQALLDEPWLVRMGIYKRWGIRMSGPLGSENGTMRFCVWASRAHPKHMSSPVVWENVNSGNTIGEFTLVIDPDRERRTPLEWLEHHGYTY